MKKVILILTTLLFNYSSQASEIKDFYGYVGFGYGLTKLSTDVAADRGDKDGPVSNITLSAVYYQKSWMATLGLGYYNMNLETEDKGLNYVKLITETFYLQFTPEYRITNRFSLGFSYQHLLGEEFLAAPSSALNVNDETTTESLAGFVAHYEIPFKSFRMRVGANVYKPLGIGRRSATIAMLTLQFGTAVYDNEEPYKTKIIYKTKEIVKLVPTEVIELGEQIINFNTGQSSLKEKSEVFVQKLAALLLEHKESWELIKIVGHTDVVGAEDLNQRLSERRASSVANILIKNNVERDRVFALGMGESKLKSKGLKKEDHGMNRRVELQFVGHLDKSFVEKVKALVAAERP